MVVHACNFCMQLKIQPFTGEKAITALKKNPVIQTLGLLGPLQFLVLAFWKCRQNSGNHPPFLFACF